MTGDCHVRFCERLVGKFHRSTHHDTPIQSAFVHKFYDKMVELLRPLLASAFKDNKFLEKGVLTGILTLAKASIFSGLNNLQVFNLTKDRFASKFGFTTQEAEQLLHYYDIKEFSAIKQWYNGYTFGITDGLFNPWSLIQCIDNKGELEMYWVNTSDNILLKKLIPRASQSTKFELEILLNNGSIDKVIEETMIFPDLEHDHELIWTLLLFTGYLTYSKCTLQEGKKMCSLVIPNSEVAYLYKDLIRKIFIKSILGRRVHDLLDALLKGDNKIFSELLQSFILDSMSSYDIPNNEPEKSYHLFVLGLLVMLSDRYKVTSNRESGLGRYDILIAPKDPSQTAVIIEFKKAATTNKDALEQAAQKALDQIISKNYIHDLQAQKVSQIIAYGIAFAGKNLFVLSKKL